MTPLLPAQPPSDPAPPIPAPPTPDATVPPIVLNPSDPVPALPAAPPTGPAPAPPPAEDPAWYDIPGQIGKALTNWFRDLLHDALSPVIDLVARTALVTPDLTTQPRIVAIWSITQGIANSVYGHLCLSLGRCLLR